MREKMKATELANPTTIPTFTCPLFGIGRLDNLPVKLPPLITPPLAVAPSMHSLDMMMMILSLGSASPSRSSTLYRIQFTQVPVFRAIISRLATALDSLTTDLVFMRSILCCHAWIRDSLRHGTRHPNNATKTDKVSSVNANFKFFFFKNE